MIPEILDRTLALYLDAAPWLLFGLLAAGLIKGWVPEAAIGRWLGGRGIGPILRGALVGAPLPLCSCGVLPTALAVRRGGAAPGPTVAFLVATPETGIDSVALSYALLGPFMALVRPLAALFGALFAGLLCAPLPVRTATAPEGSGGCSGSCGCTAPAAPPPGLRQRAMAGIGYAFGDLLDDIAPWLFGGLLLAGAVAAFVPPQALAAWGSGPLAMGAMLLVGIPMYICATASTPVAAALLLAGVSPGTVLVFLLAGPATNLATIALLRREFGTPLTAAYLAGVALAALACGLAADAAVGAWGIDVTAQMGRGAELLPQWLAIACGAAIALAALRPLRRRLAALI